MLRGQGTFLSDDEITRVVDFVGVDDPQFAGELMQLKTKDEAGSGRQRRRQLPKPRRSVRGGGRYRRPRTPRQLLAVAAGAGHRLRPGGAADRLHGRGRHRRPVQRLASPRSVDLARRLGIAPQRIGRGGNPHESARRGRFSGRGQHEQTPRRRRFARSRNNLADRATAVATRSSPSRMSRASSKTNTKTNDGRGLPTMRKTRMTTSRKIGRVRRGWRVGTTTTRRRKRPHEDEA